jgi:hypothetical protein
MKEEEYKKIIFEQLELYPLIPVKDVVIDHGHYFTGDERYFTNVSIKCLKDKLSPIFRNIICPNSNEVLDIWVTKNNLKVVQYNKDANYVHVVYNFKKEHRKLLINELLK